MTVRCGEIGADNSGSGVLLKKQMPGQTGSLAETALLASLQSTAEASPAVDEEAQHYSSPGPKNV